MNDDEKLLAFDRAVHLLKRAKDDMAGSHGPCKNNSCRDCHETWKLIDGFLKAVESKQSSSLPVSAEVRMRGK